MNFSVKANRKLYLWTAFWLLILPIVTLINTSQWAGFWSWLVALVLVPTALLVLILSFGFMITSLMGMFVFKTGKVAKEQLIWALPTCIALQIGLFSMFQIRHHAFFGLIDGAKPVITALNAFVKKNGHAPAQLSDLVPSFLPKMPKPVGLADYAFERDWTSANWELRIEVPICMPGCGVLKYSTSQQYSPDRDFRSERIGDWDYEHHVFFM